MDKLTKLIKDKELNQWVTAGVVVTTIIGGALYLFGGGATDDSNNTRKPDPIATSISHSDNRDFYSKQFKKIADKSDKEVNLLGKEIVKTSKNLDAEITKLKTINAQRDGELKEIKKELAAKNSSTHKPLPPLAFPSGNILPPANQMGRANGSVVQGSASTFGQSKQDMSIERSRIVSDSDEIEFVHVELKADKSKPASGYKNIKNMVPAGTMIKGVILGGIDAPTEVYGKDDTKVVTIRLISSGLTPNGHKLHLKNCTALAGAWGSASTERVSMHVSRLSCVNKDGQILDVDVSGVVYGPDGRQDVRGNIYYPEGKMLNRAFISGALSGIGQGISAQSTTQSVSPLGSTSSVNPNSIFQFGAATGAAKSLDKLSDYYIKRAEQLQPVVQVGAGVEVDIVINKAFFQDGEQHQEANVSLPRQIMGGESIGGVQDKKIKEQMRNEAFKSVQQVLKTLPGQA